MRDNVDLESETRSIAVYSKRAQSIGGTTINLSVRTPFTHGTKSVYSTASQKKPSLNRTSENWLQKRKHWGAVLKPSKANPEDSYEIYS